MSPSTTWVIDVHITGMGYVVLLTTGCYSVATFTENFSDMTIAGRTKTVGEFSLEELPYHTITSMDPPRGWENKEQRPAVCGLRSAVCNLQGLL